MSKLSRKEVEEMRRQNADGGDAPAYVPYKLAGALLAAWDERDAFSQVLKELIAAIDARETYIKQGANMAAQWWSLVDSVVPQARKALPGKE